MFFLLFFNSLLFFIFMPSFPLVGRILARLLGAKTALSNSWKARKFLFTFPRKYAIMYLWKAVKIWKKLIPFYFYWPWLCRWRPARSIGLAKPARLRGILWWFPFCLYWWLHTPLLCPTPTFVLIAKKDSRQNPISYTPRFILWARESPNALIAEEKASARFKKDNWTTS